MLNVQLMCDIGKQYVEHTFAPAKGQLRTISTKIYTSYTRSGLFQGISILHKTIKHTQINKFSTRLSFSCKSIIKKMIKTLEYSPPEN